MREGAFVDADGITVGYRSWPAANPKGVVLVLHGMSEHSGRYARFAGALNDAGWAVYALDHRGHGVTSESSGRGILGAGGIDGVFRDVDELRDIARQETGDVPVVVFGHSMGALIAQGYVERRGERLTGCILSGSPGANEDLAELVEGLRAAVDGGMGDEPIALLSGFNGMFEPARTPFDWLSRDEAEVDAYIADPYCGDNLPMTYGFLVEMLGMSVGAMHPDGIARIPKDLPILLVTGEQDAASNAAEFVRELERRLRDAGLDVTSRYYPGARHEVLNEINRDEVQADILGWLER